MKLKTEYEVKFLYGTVELLVTVIDEKGMSEDEIIKEAERVMKRDGLDFDSHMMELIDIDLV